ncbi:Nucleoporin [Lachnellula suecica]|uniref:Nuclear pore complex protein n=1 Tax=Lachnellula suecica TaxID=602035 RepID=A0A8T9CCN8_9HELO|nr:Nucleoporin [Lachnellula suecica]
MAPMTRSGAPSLAPESMQLPRPNQRYRETSWQFVGQPDTRSDRALSEEPPSSYDEDADMMSNHSEEDGMWLLRSPSHNVWLTQCPEDHEHILHPLREAANRVGREVEKFAEVLDGYNPQQVETKDEKYEMVMELLGQYHDTALETVERLREKHEEERREKAGLRWRKKMRGFEVESESGHGALEKYDDDDQDDSPLPNSPTELADLERWEQEAQTWDLLQRLVKLRYPPSEEKSQPKNAAARPHRYSNGAELWDDFLKTDSLARERKTVLEWLKDTAEESGEDIDELVQELQQNAERGDIIAHGWLHTKMVIKNQKRLNTWSKALDPASPEVKKALMNTSKNAPLVTQLDPDAPTRQGRQMEPQDKYFERAIWLGCYEMLRRGRSLADIKEWCVAREEVWRAVSMSGLPDAAVEDAETADPASWVLWRRMCFALAREGGGDDYERAVYGILSGDIDSVELVCRSWDDFVFAHYNALLRSQFDDYLKGSPFQKPIFVATSSFSIFDAVQSYGDPPGAGKRLMDNLRNDKQTKAEAQEPMKMLQSILIADTFTDFIYQQGLALSKFANAERPSNVIPIEEAQPSDVYRYINKEDHDSLRVITHVLLAFKHLGVDLGGIRTQTAVENVIVSYIGFLRFAGKEELIPLYCSQLNGNRRYAVLSRMLIDVTDHEQRVTHIRLMRELGLNVQEFVNMQARYLFFDYPDTEIEYPAKDNLKLLVKTESADGPVVEIKTDFIGDDEARVPRIDILLIRSFEWYLLVDGLWSETFKVGTLLYLRFFKHMHLASAKSLWERIPSSEIALRKTDALINETLDFNGLEGEGEDVTEVLDGSADRRRRLKRHLIEEAKPFRELEALIIALDLLETVRSLQVIMNEQQSRNQRWDPEIRGAVAKLFETHQSTMQPLFNKWLVTSPSPEWEEDFTLLREAYLPETILAYICALNFAGSALTRNFLMECMDLATVIAEENSALLELFEQTDRMKELVEAFATASKTLLLISSEKKSARSRGKQARIAGWQQELWNIKT